MRTGTPGLPAPAVSSADPIDAPPSWGETVTSLVCRAVHDITPDVKTFLFEPGEPALFRHEAGQFVTLSLEIDGVPVGRCYTISTPPTRPNLLGITVKRQPGGLGSNWLHDTMRPGVRIRADGPFGTFTAGRPGAKYLFLSGGSGVTPLMSMTRTAFDLATDDDIVFVHSARTPEDILFRRELNLMASLSPNLTVRHVCERDAPRERWDGLTGYLGPEMLRILAPDLHERVVYCCGPTPYMAAVRRLLEEAGFDMTRYREETFTFDRLPVGEFLEGPATTPGGADAAIVASVTEVAHSIEFARSSKRFTCGPDETILDAAFAAGLAPASSCGQGLCGTCKAQKLSGDVDMRHQGGIRPREVAAGKVLLCCSRPTSDVSLDL